MGGKKGRYAPCFKAKEHTRYLRRSLTSEQSVVCRQDVGSGQLTILLFTSAGSYMLSQLFLPPVTSPLPKTCSSRGSGLHLKNSHASAVCNFTYRGGKKKNLGLLLLPWKSDIQLDFLNIFIIHILSLSK